MVIIFIGPPGSGKGTQSQILKDSVLPNLNILTVSSLLKEKSADGSVLGDEIKNKMDNGDLIEDLTVISVLKEKVDSLREEQILVDGFPRSSLQAESLKKIFLNKNLNIINFTVSDEELLTRITKRVQEESRADDKVFGKRLSIYKKSHNEIIDSLSNDYEVINIDANDHIDSISKKIIEKLGLN
jgi:adenylate kinase